jgi:hypothetical protein
MTLFHKAIFVLVWFVFGGNLFSQEQAFRNIIKEDFTVGEYQLTEKKYLIPLKYGATKQDIDLFFGRGYEGQNYKGRKLVQYGTKNGFAWDFLIVTYIQNEGILRLESYEYYFDQFAYKSKIIDFLGSLLNTHYSSCSIEMETIDPKTNQRESYTLGCSDYIEMDGVTGNVIFHRVVFNFPYFKDGDKFGKISLQYRY